MKQLISLIFISIITVTNVQGQFTRYVVKLKNKGGTPFTFSNPSAYLSQRAIDRRTRYSIAIDSTDLPCTPAYITQIRNVANVTVLNISKWLNSVSIQTSDAAAITTISGFSFVESITGAAARPVNPDGNKFQPEENTIPLPAQRPSGVQGDFFNYGTASFNEINLHSGQFLHNIGLRGQGMQIAMLDGGFFNYTTYRAFDSANLNGQILSTWDFVAREQSVVEDNSHGMSCMSTIVANIPGQFIGKAPKASFHLFRTEDVATEHRIEEFNWACGAERADSSGADIISSSLGYYILFTPPSVDHPNSDMTGNITMAAIAGDYAAKKGLLVFNSIGNDGGNPVATHFLSTPSDGDSVLAIGAVNAAGTVGGFSSYGPSFDGQIKPDLASVGVSAVVQTGGGSVGTSNGTSFSCPNMAGLATILWQAFPEYNNMKIRDALWKAGSKFSSPDDRVGYGIPNMKTAFGNLLVEYATSSSSADGCKITINWNSKDISAMKYEVERKAPGETVFTKVGEMIPQAGVLLANRSYQFINNLTGGSQGSFSYRIRQIIDTAAASFAAVFIDTTTVNITSACIVTGTTDPNPNEVLVTVRPNPAEGSVVLLIVKTPNAVANMPVIVYDANGKQVMQIRETKASGQKIISLPILKLLKGKYYIRVFNGEKTIGTAELMRL